MTFRARGLWIGVPLAVGVALLISVNHEPAQAAAPPADELEVAFKEKVTPFLTKYCNSCHNSDKNAGGMALDVYLSAAHAKKDRKAWDAVARVVAAGEMPPKKSKVQPTAAEKAEIASWVEGKLLKVDCTAPKDPGRVTLRRLNRAEYNNTIRDLCGVDFRPADDFPADDVGYGFDNIGDVLSLQPILLEKYLTAADRILETAMPVSLAPVPSGRQRFSQQNLQITPLGHRPAVGQGAGEVHLRGVGRPPEATLPGDRRVQDPGPGVG